MQTIKKFLYKYAKRRSKIYIKQSNLAKISKSQEYILYFTSFLWLLNMDFTLHTQMTSNNQISTKVKVIRDKTQTLNAGQIQI
jgi:hypothetical protein